MPTRFNAQTYSKKRLGQVPLPSGYQTKAAPRDLTIPPVGIDDVDRALFNLFDKEIPFAVGGADITTVGSNGSNLHKVPIIFAAGEKWALSKRMRALKDRNGALILPIITIVRNSIVQDPAQDIAGRGINQQTGEIVIRRKLDRTDRDYQNLVNRLLVPHQQNLAVNPQNADPMQLSTLRNVGDLKDDPTVLQGGLLVPDRTNNIWETIVVPAPQFFTATYDITFWTQYTKHMNHLIELLIASFLPQGNQWQLNTPKGYWFLANVDGNSYTSETNLDDYSQVERTIKYKFVVKVPGYILATGVPGAPVPLKRYVSSPTIEFRTATAEGDGGFPQADDPFLGADDPTLPVDDLSDGQSNWAARRRDGRWTQGTRLYPNEDVVTNPDDPAVKQLPRGTQPAQFKRITGIDSHGNTVTRLYRVKIVNQFTGETILSPADATLGGLTILTVED
jgi:hypothetical protein